MKWYQSKAIWGGISMLAGLAGQQFGVDPTDPGTADTVAKAIQLAGAVLAIWGRTTATKQIGTDKPLVPPNALLLLVLLLPAFAFGQNVSPTISLNCTMPTTRTSGAFLPPSELAGYEFYQVINGGVGTVISVSGPTCAATAMPSLAPSGTPYLIAYAVSAIDTNGTKSALSKLVTVNITVPLSPPTTPTAIKILVDCKDKACTATVQP